MHPITSSPLSVLGIAPINTWNRMHVPTGQIAGEGTAGWAA